MFGDFSFTLGSCATQYGNKGCVVYYPHRCSCVFMINMDDTRVQCSKEQMPVAQYAMAMAMIKVANNTVISLSETCQCKRPQCLLQHPEGKCGTTVSRRITTKRTTPYCYVCKHQRHILAAFGEKVRYGAWVGVVYALCMVIKWSKNKFRVAYYTQYNEGWKDVPTTLM